MYTAKELEIHGHKRGSNHFLLLGFVFQRVLFMLRGAPPEVHLLICRPGPGIVYEVDDNTLVSSHTQACTYYCSIPSHISHISVGFCRVLHTSVKPALALWTSNLGRIIASSLNLTLISKKLLRWRPCPRKTRLPQRRRAQNLLRL